MSRLSDVLVTEIYLNDRYSGYNPGQDTPVINDGEIWHQEAAGRSAYLARLPRVCSLQLSATRSDREPALVTLLTRYGNATNKRLTRLELSGASISPATTCAVAHACPKLQWLELTCEAVDPDEQVALLLGDLLLPVLGLPSLTQVSSAEVSQTPQGFVPQFCGMA